jgi:hypothetical protein
MVCLVHPTASFAQLALRRDLPNVQPVAVVTAGHGELHGIVHDSHGTPLAGAVVSALGATTAFAVSDRDGRYAFRELPPGPYLVRAHLEGYVPERGRIVQVNADGHSSWAIALTRTDPSKDPPVLAAGIGPAPTTADAADSPDDDRSEDEVTWRLRHARRSVLKDAEVQLPDAADPQAVAWSGNPLDDARRAVATPVHLASMLGDLNGEVNFLTSTAFDRPQDLFSINAGAPHGIAYLSLAAPTATGDWTMRGTITEGDLSSWMLAGAYVRRGPVAHKYEAGYSYSMQRYQGGNAEALNAMRDGSRNVGELYGYDNWAMTRRLTLHYGAKYADYAYLESPRLFSPRLNVDVKPFDDDLTLRATVARRETAPGAEEFVPPTIGPWLPPERTFSAISDDTFTPERVDHFEIAADRSIAGALVVGVRAFEQRVDDQMVTLFGAAMADSATLGHYHVGSAGDFTASGWGVRVSRAVGPVHASVDYSQADARWIAASPDAAALAATADSLIRTAERIRDLTSSVETTIAPTATRVLVLYKLNSAMAAPKDGFAAASRFNVQVNQALPFLNFSGAQVEMIVAVRNMFHDDPLDGSIYDELLVLRPPKRMLGGVTVRF